MEHYLKVEVPFYHALNQGRKTFEARKNDRGFNEGDRLVLSPWDTKGRQYVMEEEMPPLLFRVSHVQDFGMAEGYVGLSLKAMGALDRRYVETAEFRSKRDATPKVVP